MQLTDKKPLISGERVEIKDKQGNSTSVFGVGAGWGFNGTPFDLDLVAIPLGTDGKMIGNEPAYFSNKSLMNGAIVLSEDNRTGKGEGWDEYMLIDSTKMPAEVESVVLCIIIYEGANNFGNVKSAESGLFEPSNSHEANKLQPALEKFDLTEDFSAKDTIVVGRVYKHNNVWKFQAIGTGYNYGIGMKAINALVLKAREGKLIA